MRKTKEVLLADCLCCGWVTYKHSRVTTYVPRSDLQPPCPAAPAKTYIRCPKIHVSIPRICVTTGSLRTFSPPHRFYLTSPLPGPFVINPRLHRRSPAPSAFACLNLQLDKSCWWMLSFIEFMFSPASAAVLPDGSSTVFIPATVGSRWCDCSHREVVHIEVLLRMTHRVHLRLTPSTINNGLKIVSAVLNMGWNALSLLYRNVWR